MENIIAAIWLLLGLSLGFVIGAIVVFTREGNGECLACRLEHDSGEHHG